MIRRTLLWASRNDWLARRLPRYRFAQVAARRFMPGEDLEAALGAADQLAGAHIAAVLSRLGENVTSADVAAQVADHYRMVLDRIAERRLTAHVSLKLTHLGLDLDAGRAAAHLAALARHAAGCGSVVWVDMEGSAYTQRTIDLYREVRAAHANVGLCVQAYLHRTPDDLELLLPETRALRLVKGAYAEPAGLALTRRRDIDEAFRSQAVRLLAAAGRGPEPGAPRPALATHDIALIERVAADPALANLPRDAWEPQMLYGIRADDQRRLAARGHPVRTLISYGPEWFPWFVRRLAERPANLAFVARSLLPV
jgi:proline dehydrogenase